MSGPYAREAMHYLDAGWLPVPVKNDGAVPPGFTGGKGRRVNRYAVEMWREQSWGSCSIALRADGWVGIDVDAYDGKHGAATLSAAQGELGALPATWSTSSRGRESASRIHLYAVPEDANLSGAQRALAAFGEHVDIIWWGHRYARVWPSVGKRTGAEYRWHGPDGAELAGVPQRASLTPLPPAWLAFLTGAGAREGAAPSVAPSAVRGRVGAVAGDPFDIPGHDHVFTDEAARTYWGERLDMLAEHSGPKGNTALDDLMAAALILYRFVPEFLVREDADGLLHGALAKRDARDGATDPRSWTWRADVELAKAWKDRLWTATRAPDVVVPDEPTAERKPSSAFFTDAKLAESVAREVLRRRYIWTPGQGWWEWTGTVWAERDESRPREAVRVGLVTRYDAELRRVEKDSERGTNLLEGWRKVLSKDRINAVLLLTRGMAGIRQDDAALDADPDVMNTPAGIVDLRTGAVRDHDPAALITKITRGSYRPGYGHPDWAQALTAVRDDAVEWLQTRIGQAVTGHPSPGGDILILQGGGENGKSAVLTDGCVPALGDYAAMASTKLFSAGEHSTERADLRGQRLLVAEELTEGHSIDVTAMKQIQDVGRIKARRLYREHVTFDATHALMITSNYVPRIAETDHGTWRRFTLLRFPWRFLKPWEVAVGPQDRPGDPGLKPRIKAGRQGQHDAIVTWVVDGARRWYGSLASGAPVMQRPASVELDTRQWRLDSDRILAYAEDRLVRDAKACVMRSEVLDDFNGWLLAAGHQQWSQSTFRERFEEHGIYSAWALARSETRDLEHLSRHHEPLGEYTPSVVKARVWRGCRFRTDQDVMDEIRTS